MMDKKEFLFAIKTYIEETEVTMDGEWGDSRPLNELIQDESMPEIYFELLRRIKNESKENDI